MQTGFIGLGNLGIEMVKNLIEAGTHLHIYNRTREKTDPFKNNAKVHDSIASLARACEVVFTILPDDSALESISYGKDGLIENMKSGSIHVCLSTVSASIASRLQQDFADKSIDYISATIIGRPEAVTAKATTICVSGKSAGKEQVLSLLQALGGKNIYDFGDDPTMAAIIKICTNFLISSSIEAISEAFQLAEKAGANVDAFYEMITGTILNCPIYKNYGNLIKEENYEKVGFTSQWGLKDTNLAIELASKSGISMPFAEILKNRFLTNHQRGREQKDWLTISKVVKEDAGKLSD